MFSCEAIDNTHNLLVSDRPGEMLPVLFVDDDGSLRALVREGLVEIGYEVDLADSAARARELLRTRRYSLVLSDFSMPNGNGLELLTHVNERYPDLPFILLTGQDDIVLAREAMARGALDFLAKPFGLRQLARVMEQNRVRLERNRTLAAQRSDEVLNGTIRALVAAVDAKDPHTASHSQRVTDLAVEMGCAVGLSAERQRVLEFAALLHDVGKIGVPEAILLKRGPLDDAEWAVMREHPVRSAQIVGQVGPLAEVANIVRHHHERVDGQGYPDGLCGDAIPPLARIICIVDAFEAMTADRAYRRALTPAHARELIRQRIGTQFDAEFGGVFLTLEQLS